MRSDVIKMYKEIHSWVGIISGLALFIAFYAGAITMFQAPLQRWASVPTQFSAPTPIDRVPELLKTVFDQYPEAAKNYQIVLNPGPEQPARLNWNSQVVGEEGPANSIVSYANLAADGTLEMSIQAPSQVSHLVDDLHRQVGLPFSREVAMPIMGAISLIYCIAIVSGIIVLLPTLVKDMFAFRIGKNLKRMWLDLHNILGLFSLPFHIIMSLTAVVFAFHDQFYAAQSMLLPENEPASISTTVQAPAISKPQTQIQPQALTAQQIISRVEEQAPGFRIKFLNYSNNPARSGLSLRVLGSDPRYGMRSPEGGIAAIDPYSGNILNNDLLPGHQDAWSATLVSFFTLHFGSFGGNPIRWGYFFLGLAGAVLFYTGNLLWIEMRRKKIRRTSTTDVKQTKSARVLGALTIGIPLGCVAGISLTIAAAKFLPLWVENITAWHSGIYYSIFLAAIAWAFFRGVAKGAVELLFGAALLTLTIPLASLVSILNSGVGWNHYDYSSMVDIIALIGVATLFFLSRKTSQRVKKSPEDSIWYDEK